MANESSDEWGDELEALERKECEEVKRHELAEEQEATQECWCGMAEAFEQGEIELAKHSALRLLTSLLDKKDPRPQITGHPRFDELLLFHTLCGIVAFEGKELPDPPAYYDPFTLPDAETIRRIVRGLK